MTWAETNDRFQYLLDNIEFLEGVLVPVFYEEEKPDLVARNRECGSTLEEMRQEVNAAWREAWEAAGHPSPVPTYHATPGSYLDGISLLGIVKATA